MIGGVSTDSGQSDDYEPAAPEGRLPVESSRYARKAVRDLRFDCVNRSRGRYLSRMRLPAVRTPSGIEGVQPHGGEGLLRVERFESADGAETEAGGEFQ